MKMASLVRDRRGGTAVEFALVAPTFLMMIFLMIDGGRMLFTRQALSELAVAGARCAALKPTGCTTPAEVKNWMVSQGKQRSMLRLTANMIVVSPTTACNGQTNMAQATITMPYSKGTLNLLPQSSVPANLVATSCFPVAA